MYKRQIQLPVKALFKPVKAVQMAGLVQVSRDPLEVVDGAAALYRPFNHLPLDQVVGHDVAVFIIRRAVDIAGFSRVLGGQGAADGLALIKMCIRDRSMGPTA